jgi:hypothetical protein
MFQLLLYVQLETNLIANTHFCYSTRVLKRKKKKEETQSHQNLQSNHYPVRPLVLKGNVHNTLMCISIMIHEKGKRWSLIKQSFCSNQRPVDLSHP